MKNILSFILAILVSIFAYTGACLAENSESLYLESSSTNPVLGEEFSVNLNIKPTRDINISVFRFKLNFDSSLLKYTGIYSKYGSNDFKVNQNNNDITIIFLTGEKGINLQKNIEDTLFEISFKVLSDAKEGTSKFSAKIDSTANYNEEKISLTKNTIDTFVNIEKSPESDCNLKYLKAENYNLNPKFSEMITRYSVTVPFNKSSIEITAIANDPSAKVTVSRKTLNSAGKDTDIKITVTSSDKKSKKVYTITVRRLEKTKSSNDSGNKMVDKNKNGSNNSISSEGKNNSKINIVRNHFNLFLFLLVSLFCIVLGILVLRSKNRSEKIK